MVGKTFTFTRMGMYCDMIEVEVDLKKGLPKMLISGLLSQEVRESRERVRPAILNSGIEFPNKRITINLSPAEIIKNGTHYDLAIAIAILQASGYLENIDCDRYAYFGELSLSGEIKWIRGILPMVIQAVNEDFEKIFIPHDNFEEVKFLKNKKIIPVKDLNELLEKTICVSEYDYDFEYSVINQETGDYSDIKGQNKMIEAFKIAAAGNHHMLLVGPPGSGKTMAASRLPSIMNNLCEKEIVEINKIYSIVSSTSRKDWILSRPFRSPHNSSSSRAIIGGGPKVLPGETSLAHKGILFLDEFLEFRSDTLQALRTIIEKKEVYISLRNGCAVYPADFLLIAACNPCPCGFYDTEMGFCSCNLSEIKKYRRKLKNPLIDRIDLQVKVDRINYKELMNNKQNLSSEKIKEHVMSAQEIQKKRFFNEIYFLNSNIPAEKISRHCRVNKEAAELLEYSTEENLLTARACHKILRIARTIADLNAHDVIKKMDILKALEYRFLDVEAV